MVAICQVCCLLKRNTLFTLKWRRKRSVGAGFVFESEAQRMGTGLEPCPDDVMLCRFLLPLKALWQVKGFSRGDVKVGKKDAPFCILVSSIVIKF